MITIPLADYAYQAAPRPAIHVEMDDEGYYIRLILDGELDKHEGGIVSKVEEEQDRTRRLSPAEARELASALRHYAKESRR